MWNFLKDVAFDSEGYYVNINKNFALSSDLETATDSASLPLGRKILF